MRKAGNTLFRYVVPGATQEQPGVNSVNLGKSRGTLEHIQVLGRCPKGSVKANPTSAKCEVTPARR